MNAIETAWKVGKNKGVFLGLNGLDLVTTYIGLQNPRIHEQWGVGIASDILSQHAFGQNIIFFKAISTLSYLGIFAGSYGFASAIRKRGHTKFANAWSIATDATIVGNNLFRGSIQVTNILAIMSNL